MIFLKAEDGGKVMIEFFNSLTVTGKIKYIVCFPLMCLVFIPAHFFVQIGNFAGMIGEKFSYVMYKFLKGDDKC